MGFYLDSGLCRACGVDNCETCGNSSVCLHCNSGYYVSGGVCVQCNNSIGNCDVCSSGGVCFDCHEGYYLSGVGSSCLSCGLMPFCHDCSNSSTCI